MYVYIYTGPTMSLTSRLEFYKYVYLYIYPHVHVPARLDFNIHMIFACSDSRTEPTMGLTSRM